MGSSLRQCGYGVLIALAAAAPPSAGALAAPSTPAASPLSDSLRTADLTSRLARLSPFDLDEVLWLARCIYSESDRAHEQRLVAWVVRNRVETAYRGDTYREVVLEPRQFSAFNDPSPRRKHILSLNHNSAQAAWRSALAVALDVYHATDRQRPFAFTTRHFYSPVSMVEGRVPPWAAAGTPLPSQSLGVDPERFRFYDGVDADLDPPSLQIGTTPVRRTLLDGVQPKRPALRLSGRVPRPQRPTLQRLDRDRPRE